MPKREVSTTAIRKPVGIFSQATVVEAKGKLVFISGMTARRPDGSIAGIGDITEQTRQVCENIKAAVEAAAKAKNGSWPAQDEVIDALTGLSIESLGGKSSWRKDHIADQTFVQGVTTHNNPYDFVTLGSFESMYSTDLQKPPGANFWEWIKTAQFKV